MTGLASGLLGCLFGTIGIFALALVFVPLAALCTLVGLVRGVVGRSVAGIGTSLLASVITLIAVLTSPTLLLILGGAAAAAALAGGQATADVRSPPVQPSRSASSAPVASPQAPARANVQTADVPGSGPPVSMTAAVAEAQAAITWCRNRRLSGELATYAASADCSTPRILESYRRANYRYMDLVVSLSAKRRELAEAVDNHWMTEAQATSRLAEFLTTIVTTEQLRDRRR